jgi:hypothetical protein
MKSQRLRKLPQVSQKLLAKTPNPTTMRGRKKRAHKRLLLNQRLFLNQKTLLNQRLLLDQKGLLNQ